MCCKLVRDVTPTLLRAKVASNLQGASFFLGSIKNMFPLGFQLRGNLIEGDPYWPVATLCNIPVWETLIAETN